MAFLKDLALKVQSMSCGLSHIKSFSLIQSMYTLIDKIKSQSDITIAVIKPNMKTTPKRIQESNEKLIQINQLRLKPASAGSRMNTSVIIDSPRSSQHGPAVAYLSVGVTN